MNEKRKWYTAAWAALFVLFQVIAFVVPKAAGGTDQWNGAFWIGYGFITLAFVGQYVCAFAALKEENSRNQFYRIPVITVSYTGLIITVLCGGLAMGIPRFPVWAGIVLCLCVFVFTAVSVIKAVAVAEIVSGIEENTGTQTLFMRDLIREAESLLARAGSEESRAACKMVYESLRYSDPMSSPLLSEIESEIGVKFSAFYRTVAEGKSGETVEAAREIAALIRERNQRCRQQK